MIDIQNQIAIIILNYNTWQQTLTLIDNLLRLFNSESIKIIVVDNNSSNDSCQQLKINCNQRYIFLPSSVNKGYAAGNNIGLKKAVELGIHYSLILNNDVEIDDKDFLMKLIHVFEVAINVAVVSPDIYSPEGYHFNRYSKRPSVFDLTIGAYAYKKKGRLLEFGDGKNWGYVYRPQGCCMIVDNEIMNEIGFMDEYTFLYREEDILAEKLINYGYRCGCCINTKAIHNHSYTVNTYTTKRHQIKNILRSYRYYLIEYRHFGFIKRNVCLIFNFFKNIIFEY